MEETLTVHRLRALGQLRRILSCTNVIESAFSIVENVCRNMKRCRAGDQIRMLGARGCWSPSGSSSKVSDNRQIPLLLVC
jgi:hypothetical protein